MDDDILFHLNPRQREAVLHFGSPLLIVAGAGSGKTRVITHKIAYLVQKKNVPPFHILGVTFTNRAANEMKMRIEALTGIESRFFYLSTFHSFGLRILREVGNSFGFGSDWKVMDEEEQKRVFDKIARSQFPRFTSDMRDAALHKINLAKMNLTYPNNPESLYQRGLDDDEIALFSAYFAYQKDNRIWDFEDLISFPVHFLQNGAKECRRYREKFRYILIDEFQDINPNQYELIKLIASDTQDIVAVGDDDQAIYSWRGASVRFLFDYERDFPGTKIIKLEQNYRSTQNILHFANNLIAFNFNRKGKKMWSEAGAGHRVFLLKSFSKDDEANSIANLVLALKKRNPELFPLAVLYRINSQSLLLETTFLKKKIPFQIIRGLRFFERKEIKDCVALLRLVFCPGDDLAFLRVVDFLPLGIGEKTLSVLNEYAHAHSLSLFQSLRQAFPEKFDLQPLFSHILHSHEQVGEKTVTQMLSQLLEVSGYLRILSDRGENERLLNIEELTDFVDRWEKENPVETFTHLLDRMTLETISKEGDDVSEKVFFLTMHNAKGLEFQSVIAAGINSAYMPFFLSRRLPEIEEERRLFYVAATRAIKLLVVSTGSDRSSPFVLEMDPGLYEKARSHEDILAEIDASSTTSAETAPEHFMLHPLFGKGRIVEEISAKKFLVHFTDRGNKIIDTSVVQVEFL